MNTANTALATQQPKRLSPREQFDTMRHWRFHEWRLTNKYFDAAEAAMSRLPEIIPPGAVIQLVPYLPRSDEGQIPAQYTCEFLWNHARFQYPEYHCDVVIDDFKSVMSMPGSKYKEGLFWEIINLTANPQGKPSEVCEKGHSPGAGILALAAVQPEVFKAIGKVVLLPGFKVTTVFDRSFFRDPPFSQDSIGSVLSLSYVIGDPGINLGCLPLSLDPAEDARERPDFKWVIPAFYYWQH